MSAKKAKRRPAPDKSKKNVMLFLGIVAAGLLVYIVMTVSGGNKADPAKATAAVMNNGVQEVALDVSEYGYKPDVIKVKKGVPVTVRTNSTPNAGCVRGMMIPDFNINKALDVGADSFTFTPDKEGAFEFMCQMRMSKGTLIVQA
ncbi:MAG: cupredoxin domain-containing protein [Bacillota bacterium]